MWVRLACQRHLNDLEKSKDPSYPFRFDPEKAGRICSWLELMPHVDGNWGSPTLVLELWQKFIYGSIYGWVRKDNGLRRFTKAYISVPRKNGKTTPLAGIGFFGMACDGENGAQIYNGANKRDQAELLYGPAKAMMAAAPAIFKRLGIEKRGESAIWMPRTNSRWKPVSSSPGDGGGAHYWLQDEFHEAKTAKLRDTMVQGQAGRTQPLAIFITTAGYNIGGPCYSDELQIQKLLEGTVELDHVFGIIYTIDAKPYVDPFGVEQPADDWTTEAAARKANPNWGVSVIVRGYLDELKEAIADPAKQAAHKTKRLNIWCNAADGYYNMQQWTACADPALRIEDFAGQPCVDGLDLGNKLDICADVPVFRREIDGAEHFYVFLRAWLPSAVVYRGENTHYAGWAAANLLTVTDGDITDYRRILKDLVEASEAFDIRELAFDQRESALLTQQFAEQTGVTIFEVPQQTLVLSEPMQWLKSLIVDRRIHHDGNPLLAWAMSNVVAKPDANENVFPRKAKDELKIDPHSALLNAMVRVRQVLSEAAADDFAGEVWS